MLVPGEPVDVDIEIWPTSIVVPAGYVLELGIGGRDYSNQGTEIENAMYPTPGVGPFIHTDRGSVFGVEHRVSFRSAPTHPALRFPM
ncbi:CocE/NonD family hydrolase C-terminal non-catalytic domain-containing protein [Streptomyces sp. NBC_01775]|uniref:CocE/NonD family hydrolase C-terminal non-catalytic domain-containing protein n=1 Tax=Streptomyces sp. NBC_01775 TaxID=2975939 RepID=UPI003FA38510